MIDYWELRKLVSGVTPRSNKLFSKEGKVSRVKEKGRKSNYHQFDITKKKMVKQERLLNTEEVNSFLEISCRAQACPMPLNLDVWDGLLCPFGCKYCFADAFRASLYTAFFDNSKTMGLPHCNPDYYKRELDVLMNLRGKDPHTISNDVKKAVAMEIPMRLGIRFEDFTKLEAKKGISLQVLQYLADAHYPVMINTKSSLPGEGEYLKALQRNPAKAAVHFTMISCDEELLARIEPGAPPFKERLQAAQNLAEVGVRPVARIEPFLPFVTDHPDKVAEYMERTWDAGIRHITFDTYSYSANNPGIRQSFLNEGIDFDRIFTTGCDSQPWGSLLLDSFMQLFRDYGFNCSTFDQGCTPNNSQMVCCEVGDFFNTGYNYGCTVSAANFIVDRNTLPTAWKDFTKYVNDNGGFLSPAIEKEVHELWNCEGNWAYSVNWARGIEPVGYDEDGVVWKFNKDNDDRMNILNIVTL